MILAIMSNQSPVIIISSLGAAAAVLMLVFQHTLLSLVANIQVSSNDVLQLGDWIEMPDKNLSGEVTDIALHTITIRNWDNTISRIPTKNFLTKPIPTGRRCSRLARGVSEPQLPYGVAVAARGYPQGYVYCCASP